MMQLSCRSLPVSVRVVICVFSSDLQLESSASTFYVSGYFCAPLVLLYMKSLVYGLLSNTWIYILLRALYNLYSLAYQAERESSMA